MVYFSIEKENDGLTKGQTLSNRGTQSLWVLNKDSLAAEETKSLINPKEKPFGFFSCPEKKMREPREYLKEAVYYTTVRANAGDSLFKDREDHEHFLEILKERKKKYNFKLYAYCLLPQHYHLLIETKDKNISKIMQAINTSYSLYFNKKYSRQGHLFGGRFQMELVSKDVSILELTYYIHLNPLRCGLATTTKDYRFSSFGEYTEGAPEAITDCQDILSYIGTSSDNNTVQKRYQELIGEFAQKKTSAVTRHERIGSLTSEEAVGGKRFGLGALLGVGAGTLFTLGLIFFVLEMGLPKGIPNTKQANRELAIQQRSAVSLPQGLPTVLDTQAKGKEAWEFWKN